MNDAPMIVVSRTQRHGDYSARRGAAIAAMQNARTLADKARDERDALKEVALLNAELLAALPGNTAVIRRLAEIGAESDRLRHRRAMWHDAGSAYFNLQAAFVDDDTPVYTRDEIEDEVRRAALELVEEGRWDCRRDFDEVLVDRVADNLPGVNLYTIVTLIDQGHGWAIYLDSYDSGRAA